MFFVSLLLLGKVATGYVNDYAEIISPAVETKLETRLESFTASTGNELAVVTLKSLEGDTVENTAVALFEQWGIGQKDKDNGVLLLVVPNERELKIEVGYSLEPVLTDSRAGTIIRDVITPKFKENDYDSGITDGVEAILAVLAGQEITQSAGTNNYDGGRVVLIIFIMVITFIWLMRRRVRQGLPGSRKSSWGGWSSGKSNRSSFGGFSGGSSGGGGASGRW